MMLIIQDCRNSTNERKQFFFFFIKQKPKYILKTKKDTQYEISIILTIYYLEQIVYRVKPFKVSSIRNLKNLRKFPQE